MRRTKLILEVLIKATLVVIVFYVLFERFKEGLFPENFSWETTIGAPLLLLPVLVLVPVNWLLEAKKWHYLIHRYSNITLWHAFKVVLMGLAVGFVTPGKVGDLTIRYLNIDKEHRRHVPGMVGLSRMAQFLVTFSFGIISAFIFILTSAKGEEAMQLEWYYIVLFAGAILVSFFVFFNLERLFSILKFKKLQPFLEVFQRYNTRELSILLLIALIRYVVFLMQFVCILVVFNVEISLFYIVIGTMLVFLIKSILPFINVFGGIGIREVIAIWVFGKYGSFDTEVLFASSGLWILNILIPCVVGLGFFVGSKQIK